MGPKIKKHLQEQVAKALKQLMQNGYLEKATEVRKYKSIKIALGSRELNQ